MANNENTKYSCNNCNYNTNYPSEWLKHLETQKHQRNGEKKSTKCDLCDYESTSHWNIKIHKLSQHATIEEKKEHKYYCIECDQIFFCKNFHDKHILSTKHLNIVKIKEIENRNNN